VQARLVVHVLYDLLVRATAVLKTAREPDGTSVAHEIRITAVPTLRAGRVRGREGDAAGTLLRLLALADAATAASAAAG